MSDFQLKAPFTKGQVDALNKYQNEGKFHPFTCCSHPVPECERKAGKSEGKLIATVNGWICPCGKYTQYWAHEFMGNTE